jgi:hypothetical protein
MLKLFRSLSRLVRRCGTVMVVLPLAVASPILAAGSMAHAAARLVILPVVVGTASDPEPALMSALAEGLRQNPQWSVEQGEAVPSLAAFHPAGLTDAEIERLTGEVEGAFKKASAGNAEALTTMENVRTELRAASKKGPRGEKGDELLWRSSLAMVAGLVAKDVARARTIAEETTLLFPGRTPVEADKLSAAAALLWKTSPELGARLKLMSRPEGCEVFLDGRSYGKSPGQVQVLQGETYWAHTRCAEGSSLPKKVVVPLAENTRQEVLDAEFERAFAAEGFRRIRFASPPERRQLEESYARRAAERFDADVVVLASVGELSGAEWLNARLYLRSGFLNRQGLVRLEAQRANALGRYLATGKDVPGVLKPEEAGAMVAAARLGESSREPAAGPWYTDIAGWSFLGAGTAVLGWGRWMAGKGNDKQNQAEESRGDSDSRAKLYEDAQSGRFWGGVGTVGGLLLMSTGVILLLVPEYNTPSSELFAVTPSVLPGGGGLILGGRF